MSKETPMQRMRRLLTERGIDWRYGPPGMIDSTIFNFKGVEMQFTGLNNGVYFNDILIPEKAIEMMMGETCEMNLVEDEYSDDVYFECSECHHHVHMDDITPGYPTRYCPGCGRKIIND